MLKSPWLAISASAIMPASPALAFDYLETVASPVFETDGDIHAVTNRARICLAQNSGIPDSNVQADIEGGTVVGPVLFPYKSLGVPFSVRSTLTIEVRDRRSRITQTNFTQKQGGPAASGWSIFSGSLDQSGEGSWLRVPTGRFSVAAKVEAEAHALSSRIAACMQAKASDDW